MTRPQPVLLPDPAAECCPEPAGSPPAAVGAAMLPVRRDAAGGSPRMLLEAARSSAELCWQSGRWADALIHYMEAETHLQRIAPR